MLSDNKKTIFFEYITVIVFSILLQIIQIKIAGLGRDNDCKIYFNYSKKWIEGKVPYLDYQVEYPPGAMFLFIAPYYFANENIQKYRMAFAVEMGIFVTLASIIVLTFARKRWQNSILKKTLQLALFFAMIAIMSQIVHRRFDIAPATLTALSFLLPPALASLILGVATSIKLWPAILFPVVLIDLFLKNIKRAISGIILFCIGLILPFIPFITNAGWEVLSFLKYHAQRGIQIESFWALPVLILDSLGIAKTRCDWSFGSNNAVSEFSDYIIHFSNIALVLLLSLPLLTIILKKGRINQNEKIFTAVAMITGFILSNKVLSPQFMIWVTPLLPVTAFMMPKHRMIRTIVLSLLIPLLTMLIFLVFYKNLCEGPREFAYIFSFLRLICVLEIYRLHILKGSFRTLRQFCRDAC